MLSLLGRRVPNPARTQSRRTATTTSKRTTALFAVREGCLTHSLLGRLALQPGRFAVTRRRQQFHQRRPAMLSHTPTSRWCALDFGQANETRMDVCFYKFRLCSRREGFAHANQRKICASGNARTPSLAQILARCLQVSQFCAQQQLAYGLRGRDMDSYFLIRSPTCNTPRRKKALFNRRVSQGCKSGCAAAVWLQLVLAQTKAPSLVGY